MNFPELDKWKSRLDALRPLPPAAVKNIHEDLVLRWTYNSNAIEGNTLTLIETKVVLEGITIGGKSLREHFEAVNHRDAIAYVEEIVAGKEELSERQIKDIHALILKGIDAENAGRYRNVNVTIAGARHKPSDAMRVPEEMERFMLWYKTEAQSLHPAERAARVHADFVKIHPFVDGNGRTSRLLMNFELLKSGFPAVILPVEKRLEYYIALDRAHVDGNYDLFLKLIADCVEKGFHPYWHAFGILP